MRKISILALGALVVGIVAAIWFVFAPGAETPVQARLIGTVPTDIEGFARAEGVQPLRFPQDHGPHPDYQTEWWYYTGNIQAPDGRHFGYQLTFFRRALIPPPQRTPRPSEWGTQQAYMAHFAFTDVEAEEHYAFERLTRGAAGLANGQAQPFSIWLEDWAVTEDSEGILRLQARQEGITLDLALRDRKGPILQGDQGYSRKGPEPGNASYYYSLTRLETQGRVSVNGASFDVTGWSWMDHEYSTSALSQNQTGWDWFSFQLSDGSEIMVFQIRTLGADGKISIDPFSNGTLIAQDGSTRTLSREDFSLTVLDQWRSPHTQAVYPSGWRVEIPSAAIILEIEPYLADQEMNVSYSYWEGAVRIQGTRQGQPLEGSGYAELTGYAGTMGGEF